MIIRLCKPGTERATVKRTREVRLPDGVLPVLTSWKSGVLFVPTVLEEAVIHHCPGDSRYTVDILGPEYRGPIPGPFHFVSWSLDNLDLMPEELRAFVKLAPKSAVAGADEECRVHGTECPMKDWTDVDD